MDLVSDALFDGRRLRALTVVDAYAFHQDVPLCVLTDGLEWSFYLPNGQSSYDDRRVYRLQLDDHAPHESEQIMRRYLLRDGALGRKRLEVVGVGGWRLIARAAPANCWMADGTNAIPRCSPTMTTAIRTSARVDPAIITMA